MHASFCANSLLRLQREHTQGNAHPTACPRGGLLLATLAGLVTPHRCWPEFLKPVLKPRGRPGLPPWGLAITSMASLQLNQVLLSPPTCMHGSFAWSKMVNAPRLPLPSQVLCGHDARTLLRLQRASPPNPREGSPLTSDASGPPRGIAVPLTRTQSLNVFNFLLHHSARCAALLTFIYSPGSVLLY
jgi:hypothetical protein